MQVHQVIDYSTLQIILNSVDDDLAADVDKFNIRQVFLILVDRLIDLLVVSNPVTKVLSSDFWVQAFVIRTGSLDLEDIGHDQVLVIAFRFDEDGLDIIGRTTLTDPTTADLGRIGSV